MYSTAKAHVEIWIHLHCSPSRSTVRQPHAECVRRKRPRSTRQARPTSIKTCRSIPPLLLATRLG